MTLVETTAPRTMNAPQKKRQWYLSKTVIGWTHDVFGFADIAVPEFQLGKVRQKGPSTWCEIVTGRRMPHKMTITLAAKHVKGVKVLHIGNSQVTDLTDKNVPSLDVEVLWKDNGRGDSVPHTRKKHADNVDLVFLREDGRFVQLQISLTCRYGRFYLAVQEVYMGHCVWTLKKAATMMNLDTIPLPAKDGEERVGLVMPLLDEYAFPGSNYLRSFKYGDTDASANVIRYANELGILQNLSDADVTRWDPQELQELPEEMKEKGWTRAVCTFYNIVWSGGVALCEDGKPCFIHFSSVIDEDGRKVSFPVLHPMVGLALKYKEELIDGEMKRKATAVLLA